LFIIVLSDLFIVAEAQSLAKPRYLLAAAAAGHKIAFAGGLYEGRMLAASSVDARASSDGSSSYETVDIFDTNTNQWDGSHLLSVARYDLAGAGLGNKMFFAGGVTGGCAENHHAHH
jgi:hypothetical protein